MNKYATSESHVRVVVWLVWFVVLVQCGVNICGVPIAPAGSVTRRRPLGNRPPVTDRRGAGIVEEFMPMCTSGSFNMRIAILR